MPRAVDGTRRKDHRKKILKQAKGFWGRRSKLHRTAKDAVAKAGQYAYRDRKVKKRDFRQLWIARISAAVREEGMTYSRFINGLNKAGVEINRKVLSNLAIEDPKSFKAIVEKAKASLGE
ncbi:MAG: 50S ribosomal protein L20 [Calditrichaeota bacterium]|nr:MAG: 50S ribosomal protein L20 [Calditrichota bacterium]